MNIQEAIKSGKPFRRKGWVDDEIFIVYEKMDPFLYSAISVHSL